MKAILLLFSLISNDKFAICALEVICGTGTYLGQSMLTNDFVKYEAFLGIKFATVRERFKEAIPVNNDPNQIYNSTKFGPACIQRDFGPVYEFGVEDCLYLNVFTPDVKGNFPVLFYIYGGAFTMGVTDLYNPEYFMQTRRVVVVTVAYRVGPFGFLYLDDPEFPANLGLRDQILGLKWVRKNIKNFGGDPNRITLNGQSAGAASVSILMQSPLAKGLFVGGISESGTACSPWAVQPRCSGLYRLGLLARQVGCEEHLPESNSKKWSAKSLAECLSKIPAMHLLKAVSNFPKWDLIVPFSPIVEGKSVKNPVINRFPWLNSTDSNDSVPWIIGTNSAEAQPFVKQYYPKGTLESLGVRIFNGFILSNLLYFRFTSLHPLLITAKIKLHYLFDNLFSFPHFISEILSESFFYYPNYQCMALSKSSVYAYYFNYKYEKLQRNEFGVGHGGELPFFWKDDSNIRLDGSQRDSDLSKNLVNTWIDFAYNQVVNYSGAEWTSYDPDKDEVLIIENHGVKMGVNPMRLDNLFWKSLKTNLNPMINNCNP